MKLDCNVLAFNKSGLCQAPVEPPNLRNGIGRRATAEKPHDRHRWLLRQRGERPDGRAPEKSNELPPLHRNDPERN
jgi:hypothetical protein